MVAFGTGSSCIRVANLSDPSDGRVVHDCHAIVIARRAFVKLVQYFLDYDSEYINRAAEGKFCTFIQYYVFFKIVGLSKL